MNESKYTLAISLNSLYPDQLEPNEVEVISEAMMSFLIRSVLKENFDQKENTDNDVRANLSINLEIVRERVDQVIHNYLHETLELDPNYNEPTLFERKAAV